MGYVRLDNAAKGVNGPGAFRSPSLKVVVNFEAGFFSNEGFRQQLRISCDAMRF